MPIHLPTRFPCVFTDCRIPPEQCIVIFESGRSIGDARSGRHLNLNGVPAGNTGMIQCLSDRHYFVLIRRSGIVTGRAARLQAAWPHALRSVAIPAAAYARSRQPACSPAWRVPRVLLLQRGFRVICWIKSLILGFFSRPEAAGSFRMDARQDSAPREVAL